MWNSRQGITYPSRLPARLEARDLSGGGFDMRRGCFPRGRILLLIIVFIISHLPLLGCSDNSRTTGTQVEVSEETIAHRKARAESYKGGPPKIKGKSAKKR
jgi:hypothetical protein